MKTILLSLALIFSLNSFATDAVEEQLSLEGLVELSKADIVNLRDALVIANNGNATYGICQFDALVKNDKAQVYVDFNHVNPLIIAVTDSEWLKINSDATQTQIVSGSVGEWVWKRINIGTLIKPVFTKIRVITKNRNCL